MPTVLDVQAIPTLTGRRLLRDLFLGYAPTLTGTLTFTNLSTNVSGVGTSFLAQLQPGDLVRAPDGSFLMVVNVADNFNFTIPAGYVSATNSESAPVRFRTLGLKSFAIGTGGSEILNGVPVPKNPDPQGVGYSPRTNLEVPIFTKNFLPGDVFVPLPPPPPPLPALPPADSLLTAHCFVDVGDANAGSPTFFEIGLFDGLNGTGRLVFYGTFPGEGPKTVGNTLTHDVSLTF